MACSHDAACICTSCQLCACLLACVQPACKCASRSAGPAPHASAEQDTPQAKRCPPAALLSVSRADVVLLAHACCSLQELRQHRRLLAQW